MTTKVSGAGEKSKWSVKNKCIINNSGKHPCLREKKKEEMTLKETKTEWDKESHKKKKKKKERKES